MGNVSLPKEEHWLCRLRQARQIIGCTRSEMEYLLPYLPQFQTPSAALFIVEYLEALTQTTKVVRAESGNSLLAFAQTPQAQCLIQEAQLLSAQILQNASTSVEDLSAFLNLPAAEIIAWRRRGFVELKNSVWVIRSKHLRLACKWYIPEIG